AQINQDVRVPVILVTAHHDADVLARAAADYVMAYLSKPVKPVDLEAAIRMALVRFSHFQTLAREAADLRQALEDRKVIERAKGAVVRRVGVDEEGGGGGGGGGWSGGRNNVREANNRKRGGPAGGVGGAGGVPPPLAGGKKGGGIFPLGGKNGKVETSPPHGCSALSMGFWT